MMSQIDAYASDFLGIHSIRLCVQVRLVACARGARIPRGSGRGVAHCHLKNRAAIPKQAMSQTARNAKQIQSGANGVPSTMTWRRPSPR